MELTDLAFVTKARSGDADAYRVLVERHSRALFRMAFRMTGNEQDAEDAVQATFLVLARKAKTIRKAQSLASWLHGVAFRMSIKAKRDAGRRRAHESKAGISASSE